MDHWERRPYAVHVAVPALLLESQKASIEGRAWLQALPDVVAEVAEGWNLQVGEPFRPGGQTAWVAPARDRTGRDLVLKVGRAHEEAEHEAEGLRAWNGRGAVVLHAAARLPGTVALLLERCRPGTPLGECVPEPEQDVVLAGMLGRLHEAPTGGPFRPLQQIATSGPQAPPPRRPQARRLLSIPSWPGTASSCSRACPAPGTGRRCCAPTCTAATSSRAGVSRGLVIDPKPYVGDPCYDVLQHALNCPGRLVADPLGLARASPPSPTWTPTVCACGSSPGAYIEA